MAGAVEGQKDGAGKLQAALLSKHPRMHTNAYSKHTQKVHMLDHFSQSAHTAFLGFQFL